MDSITQLGYSNNHSDGVSNEIDVYQPNGSERWLWGDVRDDVRSIVRASAPFDVADARMKLGMIFRYFAWCHSVAGVDLDLPGVFHPTLIDRYVTQTKAHCEPNTRVRLAHRIRAVAADALRKSLRETRHDGNAPRAIVATDNDLRLARDWAARLPSERLRHNADVILSLAAGAGLTTPEIEAARLSDFSRSGDLLVVRVGGRTIPVVQEWTSRLQARLRPRGNDDLVLQWAHEDNSTTHVMTMFHRTIGQRPDPAALRASYIVRLLNAHVPLTDILRVTGLQHAASLHRYLPFVLPVNDINELLACTKAATR